jgi:release factor glutamine methyltransferase
LSLSVRDALADGAAQLRAAGVESARLDARVLVAAALQLSPDSVFAARDLRTEERERFFGLLARRVAREPLAYITGTKEFWSLAFAVGYGVLIPRPETETLVEAALHAFDNTRPLRVLDIGTGSGCILIAFLTERANARGLGVDASEAAFTWAGRNVVTHGVAQRCRLEVANWEPAGTESFEVILANPPYLSLAEFERSEPEVREWEPRSALVAGEDGLDGLRSLGPVLSRRLAAGGKAFVELGAGQGPAAAEILARSGLDVLDIITDLSGIPRCLIAGRAGRGGV